MKKILLLLMSAMIVASAAAADVMPRGNRVVLKPAHEFNSITVNGNAVVECKFHSEHSGYVVYYTDNNEVPRINVVSYDNNLVIDADTTANAVTSRITVLCHKGLGSIVVNGGVLLSHRIPTTDQMSVVVNGGSAYLGRVESDVFSLVNNGGGQVKIKTVKSPNVDVVDNGSGYISIAEVNAEKLSVVNNNAGAITLNGKARTAAYVLTGSGDIYAMGLKCKDLSAQIQGSGSIGCDVKNRVVVNVLGSGSVMSRRNPREVEGNVPDAIKIAR